MSALCKIRGGLYLVETSRAESPDGGRCPLCGGHEFRDGRGWDTGWTECTTDYCDFAVLTAHLQREPDIDPFIADGI